MGVLTGQWKRQILWLGRIWVEIQRTGKMGQQSPFISAPRCWALFFELFKNSWKDLLFLLRRLYIYIYLRCDTLNFFINSQNENPSQRASSILLLSLISKCQRGIAFNKYFYTALQSNCHCVKTGLRRITHCQIPSSECKVIVQALAEK